MPYATPLTDSEIADGLARLEGWERDGDWIRRTVTCATFREAVALIDAVALAAEEADHHPDIELRRYRRVTFHLTTHAANAITERDLGLAAEIDRLAGGGAS